MHIIALLLLLGTPLFAHANQQDVLVYDDLGAGPGSVQQTLSTLREALPSHLYRVRTVRAPELIAGNWRATTAMLVMPGGADLPYVAALHGEGDAQIEQFVAEGGSYFGICAGAYYASEFVRFDEGDPEQAIVGPRALGFFPGEAIGPVLGKFSYATQSGVVVASLRLSPEFEQETEVSQLGVIVNGGPYFQLNHNATDVDVLASYVIGEQTLAAVVLRRVGQGRVLLTGAHVEFAPALMDATDTYINPLMSSLDAAEPFRRALVAQLLKRLGLQVRGDYSAK